MKGILLISHGKMAEGVFDALKLFFSDDMPQIDYLGLMLTDSPEGLKKEMKNKIKELDTGEGVIVFIDMQGGTPANVATTILLEGGNIALIAGMSLPMIMETMYLRSSDDYSVDAILEAGKNSLVYINELIDEHTRRQQ